jgi:hypothetical protein
MNEVKQIIPFVIEPSTKQRLVSIGFDPEYYVVYENYYFTVTYIFTLSSEFDKYFEPWSLRRSISEREIRISKNILLDEEDCCYVRTQIESPNNFHGGSCLDIEIEGECSSDDELLNKYIDQYFPQEITNLHETILNFYRNSKCNEYLREEYRS